MSALWTAAEAAAATGGAVRGDWAATGLSIDTRSLVAGDLFIALTDRRDGHDFVADALAKGAAAALVSRIPEGVSMDAPLLLVPDVQGALEDLGRAARARLRGRVIAVTGSVGKTSTKEMLRAALAPICRVHAAEKSFNNHWGVPLTLARCPADVDVAVIEIGMNHPGEIAPLAAIARPDVAMVTIVAPAHLEAFPDGLDGIAREKAAIFSGLSTGGAAVLNADLPTAPILRQGAAGAARVIGFGLTEAAEARVTGLQVGSDETRFTFRFDGRAIPVRLATPGRHFAANAAGALAAVAAIGGDLQAAAEGLASWLPPGGRGTRETVRTPAGAFALIDDAYNANPASLAAALEVLAAAEPAGGERVAILGDMLELGPDEAALHAAVAALPAMAAIGRVHCAGPRMQHLHAALPAAKRGLWAETAAELAAQLDADPGALARPGDVVLVKGSFGSRVATVVDALRRLGQGAATATQDS